MGSSTMVTLSTIGSPINATYDDSSWSNDSSLFVNDTYLSSEDTFFLHNPPRDSLYVVIPVTIIYVAIFLTGTIGNISTCIVIARNRSMHTATNYYLFSLAVSDLLLLISGLPAEIYSVWCKYPYVFGEVFCVLRGLAAETSTNASVLTITAFTVERYVAICHPFLAQTMSKLSRAVKLILLIWLVALSFALPQALQVGVVRHNPYLVMCTIKRIIVVYSFELSTLLFFVVPMILITVLYSLIGLKLRKSNMMRREPGSFEESRNCRHQPGKSSRRVLKMLVAVVVAFFICWAPFHVQRLVAIYGTKDDHVSSNSKWMESLYLLMTYVSGVLYYVSATINPILYNIMSNKFRVAFMETLSRSCRVPGLAVRHEQRSYSSLSRSQQRTVGVYGSRTAATAGTGVMHESTDSSGNSIKEDCPRQSNSTDPSKDETNGFHRSGKIRRSGESIRSEDRGTPRFHRKEFSRTGTRSSANGSLTGRGWFDESTRREDRRGRGSRRESGSQCIRSTRYSTVRVSSVDASTKKWWRLLKWLPGLKSLKFSGRTSCTVPENKVLDETENRREDISMSMWNIREGNDHRPV